GLLAVITGRALPSTRGTLAVPGLAAPVRIARDANGIAHVYATSADDLFFAQGWLHASERMWQMEVWRHISAGRLSELFGASQVDTDRFIRTLGWRQAAERDLAASSPDVRRVLDRYAAGVNAWLDQSRGRLGLAFVVAGLRAGLGGGLGGYDPEPWTALDSIAFAKLQAWSLGGNLDAEVFRVAADARLGDPALTDLLIPPYPAGAPVIYDPAARPAADTSATPATAAGNSPATGVSVPAGDVDGLVTLARLAGSIPRLAGIDGGSGLLGDHGLGSNNWVVAPERSATGTALLANDPHLGIQMPSIWYMNGLRCEPVGASCPYDVAGVSFPGVPGVILGHNARIAWGVTNTGPDVQDLFVETPDPADPANRYLHAGESLAYETRRETISVAGGDPVTITVRETIHGPVVNDVVDQLGGATSPYALRWTALAETDGILGSFLAVDRAGSFAEFRDALRGYVAPSQNFVYADIEGNIGYQMPGLVPIRPEGDLGDRPVEGASGTHDWTGYIPFDELPAMENPASGFIVTANNLVAGPDYPYLIHRETDPGWRATRISDLLDEAAASGGGVTQDELAAIALDTRPLRADTLVPLLLAAGPTTADGRTLQDRIRTWDRSCPVDSRGCAAYEVTEWRLLRGLFDPWLGELAVDYVGSAPSRLALQGALADPASRLWDDPATPAVEMRDGALAAALDGAGGDFRRELGDDARWTWGRIHTTTFQEQTLGTSGIGPLEWYFDIGPVAVPGTQDAPNNSSMSFGDWYPDPDDPSAGPGTLRDAFEVKNGPSYRLAIDMGRIDEATIVTTTGQAGNPFDRHYGDLVDDWLAGRSVPFPFSPAAVDAATVNELTLTP
ncbi:MAG: Penicilin amidase, partial [Chloroflexi bacterium]|nr:Penicilin amidase [Chloroflexota bacterium]